MIDEELMSKFDRIQDLPVSEEMVGDNGYDMWSLYHIQ